MRSLKGSKCCLDLEEGSQAFCFTLARTRSVEQFTIDFTSRSVKIMRESLKPIRIKLPRKRDRVKQKEKDVPTI